MKQTPKPVTAEHAAKFALYVANWVEELSLGDWRVNVSDTRAGNGDMAHIFKINLEQRLATIKLGKNFGPMEVTDTVLNETALHEVLHIFLHELIEAAKVPDQPIDTLRSIEHRVINVLERILTRQQTGEGNASTKGK